MNIRIRCKCCSKELQSIPGKSVSCGCPNLTILKGDKISAVDLSKVIMLNSCKETTKSSVLTTDDIAWQEARRTRKVRKLDFEIR